MVNRVMQDVPLNEEGFTFTDWMTSADNKDLAYDNEFTGNMVHQMVKHLNVFNTYHQTTHLGG